MRKLILLSVIVTLFTAGSICKFDDKENGDKTVTNTPAVPTPTATPAPILPNIFVTDVWRQDFWIVVTNLQYADTIKNYYKPEEGYRFCIIFVSQQNISPEVQIYTGNFILFDKEENSYEYLYELSNFHLQILKPGGVNFGHLVYEIPVNSIPDRLVLYRSDEPDIEIDLILQD